jgi:hypothetical protein
MAEEQKAPEWPLKIKLIKPVNVMGELKHEITFREPTGGDETDVISVAGTIVELDVISTPNRMNPNTPGMNMMLARLSGWPTSSIRMMSTQDLASCRMSLAIFFMPMGAPEEPPPST